MDTGTHMCHALLCCGVRGLHCTADQIACIEFTASSGPSEGGLVGWRSRKRWPADWLEGMTAEGTRAQEDHQPGAAHPAEKVTGGSWAAVMLLAGQWGYCRCPTPPPHCCLNAVLNVPARLVHDPDTWAASACVSPCFPGRSASVAAG